MYSVHVLALSVLLVGCVQSFSWDIVVGEIDQLDFYYNGTLTHTEEIPSAHFITSITYDAVHYRLLFTDFIYENQTTSISSFNLSNRIIQPLFSNKAIDYYVRIVYDPVLQLLFWKSSFYIYSFSLNPISSNRTNDGNLLFDLINHCFDIAVDSCGRYIYWITNKEIERARLDGSEREVLIKSTVWLRLSLAIDQQTQKMYWTDIPYGDEQVFIESANFDGNNRKTLDIVRKITFVHSLAVSKEFIYWVKDHDQREVWKLLKNTTQSRLYSNTTTNRADGSFCGICHLVAANYTIEEQYQGIKSCHGLQSLIPNSKPECTDSICQNHCLQGDCDINAEGQPKVTLTLSKGVKSKCVSTVFIVIVNVIILRLC